MNREEFLDLELDDQIAYLNSQCEAGKGINDISAEISMDQREMGKFGIYFVKDRFMGKPMRGYQTAKRSGNEVTKFDGAEVLEESKGAKL